MNCYALSSVTFGEGIKSIYMNAFMDCGNLKTVDLPKSLTFLGDAAFAGCEGLTSVTIPGSVGEIHSAAFGGCVKLASVTIGYGVKKIGVSAFESCTSLESIAIPASVTTLEPEAFKNCTSLKSLEISPDLYKKSKGAFSGCTVLTEQGITFTSLASNTLSLKGKTAKVKYMKVRKKNQLLSVSKVLTFKNRGTGTLTYKKYSGNKKIVINSKNGIVTVKKKLKRGTYKVTVKVMASGSATVKSSGWKKVTFKIRVR